MRLRSVAHARGFLCLPGWRDLVSGNCSTHPRRVPGRALDDEAIESGVLGEDVGFFLEDIADGVAFRLLRLAKMLRGFRSIAARGCSPLFGQVQFLLQVSEARIVSESVKQRVGIQSCDRETPLFQSPA